MKIKKKLLFGIQAIILSACATPSYNYVPEVTYISRPELGVKTTAAVGDEMLTQGNLSVQEGISLTEPVKISMYSFSSGFYPKTGDDENHNYYSFVSGDGQVSVAGLGSAKKGAFADPLQSLAVTKEDGKLCAVTAYNIKSCKQGITFREDNKSNESLSSFQQTLIYSGRVGDKINVGYREFSGNAARPAFNNDVEYDLSEDNQIAYKGAEIEVLDADNKEITYVVVKNFRQPNN